jgi:hypothetical protein
MYKRKTVNYYDMIREAKNKKDKKFEYLLQVYSNL